MYAVIFKAKSGTQDGQYADMVRLMREVAFRQYHCVDFIALTEGDQEIAISYWKTKEDVERWHEDIQHVMAQRLGQEKWYQSYSVEIAKIEKNYCFPKEQ
ncbi:MAG: antibiotic biosynthesis monooxygenase family protein [Vibrio sp.]